MSKYQLETVACPECGRPHEAKVYVSVNADRMRTVTDRLLDGSFGVEACSACRHRFRLDHRMLYSDLPHGRWIVQHPWTDRMQFPALESEAEQVFQLEYRERPPAYIKAQAERVSPRICFGRGELVEKLALWRHGLDDRALEACKLVLLRNHLDVLFPLGPCELLLMAVEPEGLLFVAVGLENGHPLDRLRVPEAEYRRVADDLEAFRPAFPELFDHAYVNASRYLM